MAVIDLVTLTSAQGSTIFGVDAGDVRGISVSNAGDVNGDGFDYEAKSSDSVRIRSTDAGGLFTEKAFGVTVTNVNEAPTSIDLANTAWLYWNSGGAIWRSNADGTGKTVIVSPSPGSAIGTFDIDKVNERIYFAEAVPSAASNSKIYSTAIDGSDRQTIYNGTGLGHVNFSLAVDATSGYVFLHSHDPAPVSSVGPHYDGKVQRISIVTGEVTILPTTFWYVPDLEVSTTSKLYLAGFSDFTESSSRFFTQQLDGAANQEVPVTGLATVDFSLAERTNSVYVSTGSPSATTGDIYRVPLTGGTPTIVFNGSQAISDVEYEEPTGLLYWITSDSIYRSSAQGTNAVAVVTGISPNNSNHLSIVTNKAIAVSENLPNGTLVGFLSTSDSDSGDTFTYTLVNGVGSNDNASFSIVGNQLKTAASFDYEAKSSYSVRIRSTDAGGLFTEKDFVVSVTNVNEAPTNITLSNSSIAENAGVNAVVGTLTGVDPDASSALTFTLPSGLGSNSLFSISGTSLRANASLSFESQASHLVTVRVSDGLLTFDKQFTISVTSVPDTVPPMVTGVIASGSAWSAAFIDAVDGGGTGAGNGFGYALTQGLTLPNAGINRIYIQFSEPVVGFNGSTFALLGVNVADYVGMSTVSYDSVNMRGVIQLSSNIVIDKLRVGVSDAVKDVALNSLDGDSNATAGGRFDFRFNVLVGNASSDGSVNGGDLPLFAASFNKSAGNADYNPRADWNSDGSVNGGDLPLFASNFNQSLPSGDPGSLIFPPPSLPDLFESEPEVLYALFMDAFFSQLDDEDELLLLDEG